MVFPTPEVEWDDETPPTTPPSFSDPSSHPALELIIPAEEVITLPEHARRVGSVFRGYWNDSLVAVKLLCDEAPVNVNARFISFSEYER
jgi:hypothetical protein